MLGSTGTHPSRTPDSTFCASTFVPSITSGPKMHHLRGNYPPSLGSNMNNFTERYKQLWQKCFSSHAKLYEIQ